MSSSGATPSPSDSVIAGDFGAMSSEEQERQRQEWKAELAKTEEEMATLRQVLAAKEAHAAGLKRRLGITAWREFSEDMSQGIKSIQVDRTISYIKKGVSTSHEGTQGEQKCCFPFYVSSCFPVWPHFSWNFSRGKHKTDHENTLFFFYLKTLLPLRPS